MAYTYTKTLNTAAQKRAGLDAMRVYIDHLPALVQNYNSDLVSITWNGTTLALTVTNRLPADLEEHFTL